MIREMHTVTGILPLGLFLIYHLWCNWAVLNGREHWVDRIVFCKSHFGFEVTVVFFVSLFIHAFLSLRRYGEPLVEPLVSRGSQRLQQVTGILSLLFLGYHIYHIWPYDTGPHTTFRNSYDSLWMGLSMPMHMVLYVVGITVVYFHFSHGIFRASVRKGLVSTGLTTRVLRYVIIVTGIVMWSLTLHVIGHFVTGFQSAGG